MYERFLLLLKKNNMSVAEFSRKTGIKQSTLSNWKTRNTLISTKYARLIANFFGASPSLKLAFYKPSHSFIRYSILFKILSIVV